MAARAGIKFSTRGAGSTIGKVKGVGTAFGGLGKGSKSASFGLGRVAYQIYNTLARISMVRRGVRGMSREVKGAENRWRGWGRAIGGPFTSVLAGVSKKFAEVRRTVAFYILAIKDYVRWGKKAVGIRPGVPKAKVPVGAPPPTPPVKPPPAGISSAFRRLGGIYRFVATAAKVLTGVIAALSVVLTAAYVAAGYYSTKMAVRVVTGFMRIRETFREYEISLGGIVRNTQATAKIMKFAMKYAAEYPAMFEDVIDAFRGLASMPTLKPMFRKADYDDLKGIMDVVQGLATLKPQQGVKGAMMALRESLSGQMRSLRMRFEVNVREMAEAAGFSFTEITHDASKALIAIRKFVELNVPAQAMASMAKTISVQYGNLYDKYRTFVNEMMRSTSAYWAVVIALMRLNEWLEKVFAAPAVVKFGQLIGNSIREIVRLFETAMGGFDLVGYLKTGDVVGAVRELCARIRIIFSVLWEEFGEKATKAVKTVISILWSVLGPAFKVLAASFWEMFKTGAKDAGYMVALGFAKSFNAALLWMIKKPFVLEKPLADWGEKQAEKRVQPSKKGPLFYKMRRRGEGEVGAEYYGRATDPEAQLRLVAERVRKQAAQFLERVKKPEREPVEVGEEIVANENKRLKIIRMALRQFKEWSDQYKWQKKDAEGLFAVTKKIADIIAFPKLVKERKGLAEEIDKITVALKKANLAEGERIELLKKDEELQDKFVALTDRMAVAGAAKAEDVAKLLQAGIKARDTIIEKEKGIVEQIKKAKIEMEDLNTSLITGVASTTVSFYDKWKKAFRRIGKYAQVMFKTMIPADIFGQRGKKVTWQRGLERPTYGKWKGVPSLFRSLIERMQGAIRPEESAAVRHKLTEGIMGLYEKAMPHARGKEAKVFLLTKMMGLFPKILSLQVEQAREAMAIQKEELDRLRELVAQGGEHTTLFNAQLGELAKMGKKAPVITPRRDKEAEIANPKLVPASLFAQ